MKIRFALGSLIVLFSASACAIQSPAEPDANTTFDQPQVRDLADNLPMPPSTALPDAGIRLQLAGDAPCNPKVTVCDD